MRLNIRIGRISQWLTPGYSHCYRCLTTWCFVEGHATPYDERHACFPLCQKCWSELAPTQRLPFYCQLWEEWNDPADMDWADIAFAVLEGR